MKKLPPFLLASFLSILAACSGGGGSAAAGSSMGEVEFTVTDAPFTHDLVVEARVRVLEVHMRAEDGGFVTVSDGTGVSMDLTQLTNGVSHFLAQADVPTGKYDEVRLVIDDARLVLVNGDVFSTALGNLKMTSLPTSGLKVKVDPPIRIDADERTRVLLDFDLAKTFKPIPANDPLSASSYMLKPVVHAMNLSLAGGLEGFVTTDDGTGAQVGVGKAGVYVLPPGSTDPDDAAASTATGQSGGYAFLGLVPGDYDVLATKGALSGLQQGVTIEAGQIIALDLVIQ